MHRPDAVKQSPALARNPRCNSPADILAPAVEEARSLGVKRDGRLAYRPSLVVWRSGRGPEAAKHYVNLASEGHVRPDLPAMQTDRVVEGGVPSFPGVPAGKTSWPNIGRKILSASTLPGCSVAEADSLVVAPCGTLLCGKSGNDGGLRLALRRDAQLLRRITTARLRSSGNCHPTYYMRQSTRLRPVCPA